MEDRKEKNAAWLSVPQFGDWDQKGNVPDYSMDFSKIREMRKQNKRDISRASLGNEDELINPNHNKDHHHHHQREDHHQIHHHSHSPTDEVLDATQDGDPPYADTSPCTECEEAHWISATCCYCTPLNATGARVGTISSLNEEGPCRYLLKEEEPSQLPQLFHKSLEFVELLDSL